MSHPSLLEVDKKKNKQPAIVQKPTQAQGCRLIWGYRVEMGVG
jgi:hypothetical protein